MSPRFLDASSGRVLSVLTVPDDDPRFSAIQTIDDFLDQNLREIEQFIEVYKQLEGDDGATVHGWVSLEEAHDLIRKHTL